MSPFILSQKSRYHGNNVEGYAPMCSACCLFLTLLLPAGDCNVCRHGDRLFHLVNMMWHVSSCTSQEMTGDWFILLPTQTMNDDTVKKKLRSQYQKGQFEVLFLKRKKSTLSNIIWCVNATYLSNNGQTVTLNLIILLLPNVSLSILASVSLSTIVCDL